MHKILIFLFSLILISISSLFAKGVNNTKVLLETNMGSITLELFDKKSPVTVKNFIGYIKKGYYDGLIFHRVIPRFMIQGGGFNINMKKKSASKSILNESKNKLSNYLGTVAMARTQSPHSASNQFFINLSDNKFLDAQGGKFGYAVFGKVIVGMNVVKEIGTVKTKTTGHFRDVPMKNVIIKKASIL